MAADWHKTSHCESRVHCRACRTDPAFRASVEKSFGPFDCPLGLPVGHGGPWPEPTPPTEPRRRGGCGERPASGGRTSCIECVEKHIGAAMVMIDEVADGYDAHRLRAVGHLHEAADESRAWPELHDNLRAARRAYQADGAVPDWDALAAMAARIRIDTDDDPEADRGS
jgi:hypothetical protein